MVAVTPQQVTELFEQALSGAAEDPSAELEQFEAAYAVLAQALQDRG